jgi:hypothetical protein
VPFLAPARKLSAPPIAQGWLCNQAVLPCGFRNLILVEQRHLVYTTLIPVGAALPQGRGGTGDYSHCSFVGAVGAGVSVTLDFIPRNLFSHE